MASESKVLLAADIVKAMRAGPVHSAVMKALANGATSVEIWSEAAAELYVSVMGDELHKLGVWISSYTETQSHRLGSSTGYESDGELQVTRTTKIHLRPIKKPSKQSHQ